MSALQDELKATIEREMAKFPSAIGTLVQRGMRDEWDQQDAKAATARANVRALGNAAVESAHADLEVILATIARLECDLLIARRQAVEAQNRRAAAVADRDRQRRLLQRASLAPYQLEASRRVLDRLLERLMEWKAEPPPLRLRPFSLKAIPDPRYPGEEQQRFSVDSAVQVVTEASHLLYAVERGTAPAPDNLEAWLERTVNTVEEKLVFEMKDEVEDPAELERMKTLLRLMSIGSHPVYVP